MSGTSTDLSTRAIQHAAKELGDFDVICGKGDLSFAINSKMFCKEQLEDVTCYAFSSEY
jgi:peroxiredoxin